MPAADIADDRLVCEVEKNKRERFRVALRTFHGRRGVDLRVHALQQDGTLVPTGKGVVINPQKLREVIDALTDAEKAAKTEGLLP